MARPALDRAAIVGRLAEIFREYGYEGASLSRIAEGTGLGKGSLYHLFPGGKEEMAASVLAHVDAWFVENVYRPLERDVPAVALAHMWQAVDAYFRSGRRVCLVGAFALDATRDRFADAINAYFARWIAALADALARAGRANATALAEEIVLGIQGALVLARATGGTALFGRTLTRLRARVTTTPNP
ncbi:MAG: TetR/AcrR family transcriptional regulator [Acidiphilium sp.]